MPRPTALPPIGPSTWTPAFLPPVLATAARLACVAVLATVAAGCASKAPGLGYLPVPRDAYERAFAAACEVAREEGLAPEVSDAQSGTIETQPRTAASIAEPWGWRELTATEVVEGTFGFERRRARFEFVPAGFRPVPPEATAPLAGPVLPGSGRAAGTDVTEGEGGLELRVSVSVERQFRPGHQGPAYTRALGSYARDTTLERRQAGMDAPRDRSTWTPVARDERLERELLEKVRRRLASGPKSALGRS